MSCKSYTFGTCDLCKKEIDTRKDNIECKKYWVPSYSLYYDRFPSALPSYKKHNIQQRGYDLCDECALKFAKLLYDTYGWYYEDFYE